MAIFTITSPGGPQPPADVGNFNIYLANRVDKVLTSAMFTTITNPVYSNSDNSAATHIKILSLPGTPEVLTFNGVPVIIDQEISIADINLGLLLYDAPNQDTLANNSFAFTVKTATQEYAVDTGTFNITSGRSIAPTNQPPTVGDIDITIDYNTSYNFVSANLTSNTTPAYFDVEGNAPSIVKITTLPEKGVLLLSGVPVTIDQEIPINNIANLVYVSDNTITDQNTNIFKFRIKDTGSGLFSDGEGQVSIFINELIRNNPTVSDNSALLNDKIYTYKIGDFTKDFEDIDGDSYSDITIKSLPLITGLRFLDIAITLNQTFSALNVSGLKFNLPTNYAIYSNILYEFSSPVATIATNYENLGYKLVDNLNGRLTFKNLQNPTDIVYVQGVLVTNDKLEFDFTIKDDSVLTLESNVATFSLIPQGNVNVLATFSNDPPVVGNAAIDNSLNERISISKTKFTEQYADPENDVPFTIRIESLLNQGTLVYNGVPVAVGQVLNYDFFGLLEFVPDVNDLDGYVSTFNFSVSDKGSYEFSNVATVTVTVAAQAEPPTVDNNSGVFGNIYTFPVTAFINNFLDADADAPKTVIIKSLPSIGVLKLLGVNVSVGTTFVYTNTSGLKFHLPDNYAIYNGVLYEFTESISSILTRYDSLGYKLTSNVNGVMTFTNLNNTSDTVNVTARLVNASELQFTFKTTDDSVLNLESNLATFSLIPQTGNLNVASTYVNLPPVVGDNNITVQYNEVRILTQKYFVEETNPVYFDPENDAPFELKVLSLPLYGHLLFDNQPVNINQVISFADINASKFKYVADIQNLANNNTMFRFAVSDVGSKTFIS